METNELPEGVKAKIDEEADKYGFVVPYDGSNQFYKPNAVEGFQAGAEFGYRLALQSKEEEVNRLKNDLLDALDLKEGNGPTALSMLKSANDSLQEQLKAKDKEIARLKVNIKVGEDLLATINSLTSEVERLREENNKLRFASLDPSETGSSSKLEPTK